LPEDWDSFSLPPPDPNRVSDPPYWRDRAERVRTVESEMKDIRAINAMLLAAQNYDIIAELQEARLSKGKLD
jgi:hypothetical protein